MKIGIVLYSETGNTLAIAKMLKERLMATAHEVEMIRLNVEGGYKQGMKDIRFESLPDVTPFDAIVFGSPVEAFSLSPVMNRYLQQVESLSAKKIAFLITQFFPYAWMGGKRAVRQMVGICKPKGASIVGFGIVNWMGESRRAARTEKALAALCSALK